MEHKENSSDYIYLENKKVGIIGVSTKEGQGLEGPEKAPEYLRNAGLYDIIKSLEWEYQDYQDVKEENAVLEDLNLNDYKYPNQVKNSIHIGAACKSLNMYVKKIAEKKQFSLILGGDHGIATGSISGLKSVYPDLKVIWIDAHSDCNMPEESPSGNYHGMPVAHLFGWIPEKAVPGFDWFKPCLTNEDLVFIGLRDIDYGERINLKKHNIKCFTMHEVVKYGIGTVVEKAIEYLNKDGKTHPIHISFDVDGIDPSVAYGTGTKSRGGLLYREAQFIVREVAATGRLVGLDLVEINPLLDRPKENYHGDNKNISAATETVSLGLELVASALGHRLL
jgi:arginase